tara:strand:- start:1145 stop:3037 length:1893 start_codon:yes stop_codon:yes gene_type:complete
MLQFIRSKVTSIFIKVLFGILILSFAIWGIGDIFLGNKDGEAVISIGDKEYNANYFLSAYEKARRAMRLPPEYEDLVKPQIIESVKQSIIRNGLLSAETLNLNLVYGDTQLKKWVGRSEAFRDSSGKFDPELLRQALFNSGLSEADFFSSLREEMRNNQLISAVASSVSPPDILIEKIFKYRNEKRTVNIAEFTGEAIASLPEQSESDLRKLYTDTKSDYMAPVYRSVTYVHIDPKELAKDIMISEEAVAEEYDARRDELTIPGSRDLKQLIFSEEDLAQKFINSITSAQSTAEVTKRISEIGETANVLEMKDVTETDLIDTNERKAAFETPVGQISSIIETSFGWKVFFPIKNTPEVITPLSAVRQKLRDELSNEKALDNIFDLTNVFEDSLAGGASIEQAAREINFRSSRLKSIDNNGKSETGTIIGGITGQKQFLSTVFDTPVGEQSQLLESEDGGYFVLRIESETKARQKPFNEVIVEVKKAWEAAETKKALMKKAKDFAGESRNMGSLIRAAEKSGIQQLQIGPFTRFGEGIEAKYNPNELASIAFELRKNDIGIADNGSSVYVLEVVKIAPAKMNKKGKEWLSLEKELISGMKQDYLEGIHTALKKKFNVSINQNYIEKLVNPE